MSTNNCPACGAPVSPNITECRYCGENIPVSQPQSQASSAQNTAHSSSKDAKEIIETITVVNSVMNNVNYNMNNMNNVNTFNKSKTTAGILAILLGGFGIHKFYLGKIGWGIVYLIFCWTYIPSLLGLIEGIIYLTSSEQSFNMKYGKTKSF